MNEQLAERIRQCPNLPSLPTIAIQVLELVQRPDVDIAQIARTISKDSALASKILRTVNSSFYARSHAVSTISHALVILGLQSVKTLVLGFSLVSNLRDKGFKHLDYWRRSIYAATAARALAAKVGVIQQEEAFLAGLLADIGMLVLDQIMADDYGRVCAAVPSHGALVAAERASFGMDHAEAAGVLAAHWKLPPVLAVPMSAHHEPSSVDDPTLRRLAEVVYVASRCADVFVDQQPAEAITDLRQLCLKMFQLPEADCDALMSDIGARTKEIAPLFDISLTCAVGYDEILKRANEALVEITLQSQQQANAMQQRASTLAEQNQELKRRATTDGLTGLSNRARFDAFLKEAFEGASKKGAVLSLLLVDVDKFKSVNDQHGHPAGDKVLQAIGAIVGSVARPCDLAARYGGEEMALILPGADRTLAAAVAENLRRAISAKPMACNPTLNLPITASIGVATFEPKGPLKEPAHLIKAADLALYAAKHSGRNCVRVFTLSKGTAGQPAAA